MRLNIAPMAALCAAIALAAGCGRPAGGIDDPFEDANRAQFAANLRLDAALSGDEPGTGGAPASRAALERVRGVAETLSLPGTVANDLLQLRPDRAIHHSLRFAVNATFGLGGLFDPAGAIGLHGRSTDFGETLHVWGIGEGAYLVLPVLGPSTQRDAFGMAVDLALDPVGWVLPRGEWAATLAVRAAGLAATRVVYSDLLDANVMQSADPYAQARLLFLQNRRYHLGATAEEDFIDPYAEFD